MWGAWRHSPVPISGCRAGAGLGHTIQCSFQEMLTEQLSHLGQGVHCGEEGANWLARKTFHSPHSLLDTKGSFLGILVVLTLGQMKYPCPCPWMG